MPRKSQFAWFERRWQSYSVLELHSPAVKLYTPAIVQCPRRQTPMGLPGQGPLQTHDITPSPYSVFSHSRCSSESPPGARSPWAACELPSCQKAHIAIQLVQLAREGEMDRPPGVTSPAAIFDHIV